jgi:hypothetical protein
MNHQNHLWVLSNRALESAYTDERCLTETPSQGLSATSFHYRGALIGPGWSSTIEASHLDRIAPSLSTLYTTYNNGKPWVFFVHGNHSHFTRVLRKCKAIMDLYDVNVFTFSWPSFFDGSGIWASYAAYLINRELFYKVALTKRPSYRIARERAQASWGALNAAIEIFHSVVTGPEKKVFMTHSMGNFVLQNWIIRHPPNSSLSHYFAPFYKVLLVQSDVDIEDHRSWLDRLAANDRMIITQNRHDLLLHVSDIIHQCGREEWRQYGNRRLGSFVMPSSSGSPSYVDFSVIGRGPLAGHCLFDRLASRHEQAFQFFESILRAGESTQASNPSSSLDEAAVRSF